MKLSRRIIKPKRSLSERLEKTATFPLMRQAIKGGENMTNAEKFIEIMNKTFNARMTVKNLEMSCSPCGTLKKFEHGCDIFECKKCEAWWHKEYKEPQKGE